MNLQDELDAVRARELAKTPASVRELTEAALEYVRSTGINAHQVKEGDPAPLFELPSVQGPVVALRDLLRRGPVILDFFRGGWCPFCSLELRAYQQIVEGIEHAGATLVAISPERLDLLAETVAANDITFPVLSDHGNRVAKQYGIVYEVPDALRKIYEGFGLDLPARNDSPTAELPVPATYLVDQEGIVRRSFVEVDYSQRAEPRDFVAALNALGKSD